MEQRRAEDQGVLCWIAMRCSQAWDFVDNRDIDKHLMAWAVFGVTFYMVFWMMEYIWDHGDKPGIDVGAVIAALMIPWTPVQAAVIAWYFKARE